MSVRAPSGGSRGRAEARAPCSRCSDSNCAALRPAESHPVRSVDRCCGGRRRPQVQGHPRRSRRGGAGSFAAARGMTMAAQRAAARGRPILAADFSRGMLRPRGQRFDALRFQPHKASEKVCRTQCRWKRTLCICAARCVAGFDCDGIWIQKPGQLRRTEGVSPRAEPGGRLGILDFAEPAG